MLEPLSEFVGDDEGEAVKPGLDSFGLNYIM